MKHMTTCNRKKAACRNKWAAKRLRSFTGGSAFMHVRKCVHSRRKARSCTRESVFPYGGKDVPLRGEQCSLTAESQAARPETVPYHGRDALRRGHRHVLMVRSQRGAPPAREVQAWPMISTHFPFPNQRLCGKLTAWKTINASCHSTSSVGLTCSFSRSSVHFSGP